MKKAKRANLPAFVEVTSLKKRSSLYVQIAIRVLLFCMAAFGTALTFVQTYSIEANTFSLALFSFGCTLVLSGLFMLLKYRFALPIVTLFILFLIQSGRMEKGMSHLFNYFLHLLDSRILFTSQFATISVHDLDADSILLGVYIVMFFICLLYAFAVKVKFVGSVLITVIAILIPSFIAEFAHVDSGIYLVIISMMGLYGMWVGHERGVKPSYQPPRRNYRFSGGTPYINSHGTDGLLIAIATAVCVAFTSNFLVDNYVGMDEYIQDLQSKALDTVKGFGGDISYYSNSVEHNGYFASGTVEDYSNYIHLNSPSNSDRPVLKVARENQQNPLYLRGTVCLDYNSEAYGWTVINDSPEVTALNELMKTYYPESEYFMYTQRLRQIFDHDASNGTLDFGEGRNNYEDYIGLQNVNIEYLLNTKVILMPTALYMPSYHNDDTITQSLDTVLRSKRSIRSDSFATFFPKKATETFYHMLYLVERIMNVERASDDNTYLITEYSGEVGDFSTGISLSALGTTPNDYLKNRNQYKKLINEIYTKVPAEEQANIDRLRSSVVTQFGLEEFYVDGKVDDAHHYGIANIFTRFYRLNENFSYSLDTDNLSGDNTMLGNFLFETRSGHCALYATALTLLLRDSGIPARYVTGYAVNREGTDLGNGMYETTVLERDLHAWVEVYVNNLGWVPFDPTPASYEVYYDSGNPGATAPFSRPDNDIPPSSMSSEQRPEESDTTLIYQPTEEEKLTTTVMIVLVSVAAVLLLATICLLYLRSLVRKEKRFVKYYSMIDSRRAAANATAIIMHMLKLIGLERRRGELPLDFARRVDEDVQFPYLYYSADDDNSDVTMECAIRIVEKIEFSRQSLTEKEYRIISDYTLNLYRCVVTAFKQPSRTLRRILVLSQFNIKHKK